MALSIHNTAYQSYTLHTSGFIDSTRGIRDYIIISRGLSYHVLLAFG